MYYVNFDAYESQAIFLIDNFFFVNIEIPKVYNQFPLQV